MLCRFATIQKTSRRHTALVRGELIYKRSLKHRWPETYECKKEPAGSKSPRITANAGSFTGSAINISNLLDFVNQYFSDILPEEVRKRDGYQRCLSEVLGEVILSEAFMQTKNANRGVRFAFVFFTGRSCQRFWGREAHRGCWRYRSGT